MNIEGAALSMPTFCSNCAVQRAPLHWLVLLVWASLSACSAPTTHTVSQITHPRLALATAYYQNGQFRVALDESQKVLGVLADHPQALSLQGLIYMRLGEPVLAQKSFLLAEKTAPLDADIAHNHAVFLCEQGHYKNSFERFESAMNRPLYSEKAKTMWVWGVCSHKSGDIQSAQQLWTQSLTIKATAETALALALSLKQHNQDARAAEVLKNFNVLEAASAETLLLGVQWARQSSDSETSKRYTSILRQRFPTSAQWGALQREAFDD